MFVCNTRQHRQLQAMLHNYDVGIRLKMAFNSGKCPKSAFSHWFEVKYHLAAH